jgi:hypothetical protein
VCRDDLTQKQSRVGVSDLLRSRPWSSRATGVVPSRGSKLRKKGNTCVPTGISVQYLRVKIERVAHPTRNSVESSIKRDGLRMGSTNH